MKVIDESVDLSELLVELEAPCTIAAMTAMVIGDWNLRKEKDNAS